VETQEIDIPTRVENYVSTTPTLPSTEEEIWRYSRIEELDLARFSIGTVRTETIGAEDYRTAKSVTGIAVETSPDVFEELNAQHASDVVSLRIPAGVVVESPIEIVHSLDSDGVVAYPRVVIDAEENSEVTVVERFVSNDAITSLVCPVLEVRAGKSARVTYVSVNQLGQKTWKIAHQQAVGYRDSTTRLFTVALGGDYARVRSESRLVEQGANSHQTALYFASGTQMHDFRTLQHHIAPRTYSDLLFKGAVRDTARSVYTGLIRIGENASGSQAFQTNRNLTLSEGAWAESVPNLEIETNDVKCSHASTVGSIDADQKFYLESRGIPSEIAERLVVIGFFDEVIERLPKAAHVDVLRTAVIEKLNAEKMNKEVAQ
jgi:Fe-S cluster assembly protein SufD